jgi:hypothetical protein
MKIIECHAAQIKYACKIQVLTERPLTDQDYCLNGSHHHYNYKATFDSFKKPGLDLFLARHTAVMLNYSENINIDALVKSHAAVLS